MKKILGLTVAAVLVMALVGGGTWAYFSDPETSAGNTLTAGTLNLVVGAADPTTANFTLTTKVPGDNGTIVWALDNDGDTDGYLDITFGTIVDSENTVWEPETGDNTTSGELAENLQLIIFIDENNNDTYNAGIDTLIFSDNVTGGGTELSAAALDDYSLTVAATNKDFCIYWTIDSAVGNTIMSDVTGFVVEFSLEQLND